MCLYLTVTVHSMVVRNILWVFHVLSFLNFLHVRQYEARLTYYIHKLSETILTTWEIRETHSTFPPFWSISFDCFLWYHWRGWYWDCCVRSSYYAVWIPALNLCTSNFVQITFISSSADVVSWKGKILLHSKNLLEPSWQAWGKTKSCGTGKTRDWMKVMMLSLCLSFITLWKLFFSSEKPALAFITQR